MSWGGPDFILAIIAISTVGWLVSSWIRARHGYPIENEWRGMTCKREAPEAERQIELLSSENERLHGQVSRLEERLAVLERIATDPAEAHRPRNRKSALNGATGETRNGT